MNEDGTPLWDEQVVQKLVQGAYVTGDGGIVLRAAWGPANCTEAARRINPDASFAGINQLGLVVYRASD